jgi:tetraacyldisaccharide 4'-kinase
MAETPPFWYEKRGLRAWALWPLSLIYGAVAAKRMAQPSSYKSTIAVLCIGNFVAGGAGKTPTSIALCNAAIAKGRRPVFLTRGYGGAVREPVWADVERHNAHDIGDEALLLAAHAAVMVSPDRVAGIKAIEDCEQEFDIVIMDDGFQNPRLFKDFSLVVVSGDRGAGNGFCHPAGPLRAPVSRQLMFADQVLVIGEGDAGSRILRQAARKGLPLHVGELVAAGKQYLDDSRVLAWSGIGDPGKFHRTLEALGAVVVGRKSYADHHFLHADEARDLLDEARREDLLLVSTEKDAVRTEGGHGEALEELLAKTHIVPVELKPDNLTAFQGIIDETIKRFRKDIGRRKPT